MNPKENSIEDTIELIVDDEDLSSVDDFIKQLEEKEKDLDISSDMVIEVGDSEVEHENIHNSFVPPEASEPSVSQESLPSDSEELVEQAKYSELEERIAELTNDRKELKDSLLRGKRDFDNYRNRIERERRETFTNILSNLANQMLPVLDNLNRALDSATEAEQKGDKQSFQTFLEGIVLVNQQLNEVLIEMGVQPITAVGEPFNPAFHEAVDSVETDEYPHKTVIEELLRGYRIDDRIIRASMVKVSSAPKDLPLPDAED